MKRRAVILLVLALVGTLALVLHQQRQILRVESILGTYWSNDFALVFSRLVTLQSALDRLAAGEEIEWLEAEQLDRELSGMTLHLNNTLGDARGLLPDVPRVPHLIGYLDHVREQVNRVRAAGAPLRAPPDHREGYARSAALAGELAAIVAQHYPDWLDEQYWGRPFLVDDRWRKALAIMEAKATEAGFMPR